MKPMRVISVEPLFEYVVRIEFSDGLVRDVDLRPYLRGEIFRHLLDDAEYFRTVHVGSRTITWDNGADIDPNTLYYELTPAWAEGDETFAKAIAESKKNLKRLAATHNLPKPSSERVGLS